MSIFSRAQRPVKLEKNQITSDLFQSCLHSTERCFLQAINDKLRLKLTDKCEITENKWSKGLQPNHLLISSRFSAPPDSQVLVSFWRIDRLRGS